MRLDLINPRSSILSAYIFYLLFSRIYAIHTDGVDNDRLSDSREFLNVKNMVLIGADCDIVGKYLCLDVLQEWMENVRETNLKFKV